ncbi:DUF1904 family protein [Williamsoniiplasma lucivorax]|uniref:DUF1904 domain-containing protein n=1 Tax=Williamsoniiplasma lucivorax TaxID=209274 RepID=A0A2S5REX1_9MOLU|nr:DUF1904 family protein [Williamsoniiplasma lucivorax]PPE05876.1 hypothetical protein ELUCI_v1c01640 [Williamsoniiplasma lucivorax]
MPTISISGIDEKRMQDLYQEIDKIGKMVHADVTKLIFVLQNSKVFSIEKTIYIQVEWKQRLDKEEIFAKYLKEFFKDDAQTVSVFFTDVNDKLYVNGNKMR